MTGKEFTWSEWSPGTNGNFKRPKVFIANRGKHTHTHNNIKDTAQMWKNLERQEEFCPTRSI